MAADTKLTMESEKAPPNTDDARMMKQILVTLQSIQQDYRALAASVDSIEGRVATFANLKQVHDAARQPTQRLSGKQQSQQSSAASQFHEIPALVPSGLSSSPKSTVADIVSDNQGGSPLAHATGAATSSKIILTTYPHQSGIDPIIMNWGDKDPMQRGAVVVSRAPSTIRRRNGE